MEHMDTNAFKVCVRCMTYNQSAYIKDALNGFCMQKTNFPFVCVIVDDASTDGEQEVISNYLNSNFDLEDNSVVKNEETDDYVLTFAKHKSNKNCFFAVLLLKYNHYHKKDKFPYISKWCEMSKYIAQCEGDDYWIHDRKLQMQVDFLDSHNEYGLIYTDYFERIDKTLRNGTFIPVYKLEDYLLKKGFIPTATTLFRTNLFMQRDLEYTKMGFLMGDVPLWIQLMYASKMERLQEKTAVYRILPESASHSHGYEKTQLFSINAWEVRKYFADKYGLDEISKQIEKEVIKDKALLALYQGNYWYYFKAKPWKYGIFNIKLLIGIVLKRMKNIIN